jgi:hypothetical protein
VGLPHLIGGLSAALTGALRALLDSAHINNSPTMLKLKGGKISGQSIIVEPTQVTEIEGAPGVDDVRKIAMPMPFNQPSPVLFQLLGWLTNAAKGVVTTAEEKIADVTSNAPVGTTQALIEQGAAVFSSIHARLHASQARVLKIIGRLNRWYLDDNPDEMSQELGVTAEDFEKNSDVIPVSDPNIFAESQRYAQVQTLAARAQANPDLYNRLAVEKRILKQIKLPDINEVLPDPKDVQEMNPALENVAMTLAKPVGAYPSQDHLAHIQVHLDYAKDPMYGANPIMAPTFIPGMLEHLKQHLTLWYLGAMDKYASDALSEPFDILKVQPVIQEAQQLLAASSQHVHMDSQEQFSGVVPVMQQMLQTIQQLKAQQTPTDPSQINKNIAEKVDTESEFDVIRGGKVIAKNVKFFPNGKDYRIGNKIDKLGPNDSTSKSLNENEEEDVVDTVTLDIPLFIRMLEYAKEDAQTDMDLHDVAEKAIALNKSKEMLSMEDYNIIIGDSNNED